MAGTLAPHIITVFDDNGIVAPGAKINTYLAGTSTPEATYTDGDLSVAHANPVVCDSAGRATIYLAAKSYKFVVTKSDDTALYTLDPVPAAQVDTTLPREVFHFGGSPAHPITATAYPSGATVDKCLPGAALFNIDSDNLPAGTYVLEGMLIGAAGTITIALVNLTDGAPDTALVTISSASTTGARVQSSAITFAAGGAAKDYGLKAKVSAGSGFGWACRVMKTA